MIYEGRVDIQFAEREFHFVQLVDVHSRGKFTHRNRKKRRSHWLGHDLAKRRPRAIKTENANLVFGIVGRFKKWKALDVVPVGMGNQQRKFYCPRLKFFVESDTKRPDPRAGIKDDNLAIRS